MYWISKELTALKIDVKVISTDKGLEDLYTSNVWHKIDGISVIYCSSRFVYFSEFLRELTNASIVHLNSLFYWRSLLCFLLSTFFSKQIIWSVRGELHDKALSNRRFIKTVFLRSLRLLTSRVKFHGTSADEVLFITKIFPKSDNTLIPNYLPIDSKKYYNKVGKILYLGRIDTIKNIDFLIRVFAQCRFADEIELIIAGKGNESYTKHLMAQVPVGFKKKIKFIGEIKGSQKNRYLAECSILALPSFSENFGNVIVEALSFGTPVVCSIHTPWQQLEEFNCGYHLELDESRWIDVLEVHMNNRGSKEVKEMGKRAYEYCNSYFNIKKGIRDWIKVYGFKNY